MLSKGGCYVSELARKLEINRTLLYLHLTSSRRQELYLVK
ncbi:hypothetical protein [Bacillus haynesii]